MAGLELKVQTFLMLLHTKADILHDAFTSFTPDSIAKFFSRAHVWPSLTATAGLPLTRWIL